MCDRSIWRGLAVSGVGKQSIHSLRVPFEERDEALFRLPPPPTSCLTSQLVSREAESEKAERLAFKELHRPPFYIPTTPKRKRERETRTDMMRNWIQIERSALLHPPGSTKVEGL